MNQTISVKTNHLTRRFGKFVAVDKVSIEVYQKEIFGFLGANGAGKTTMIRMLCGLLKPSDGDGTVAGFDIKTQSEIIKQNIGYMSQKFSLYEDLTISENIEFYGGVYGLSREKIEQKKDELFKQLKLDEYAKKYTRDLPLGIRQRLALGSALLHDPPIIFLDEPTSGVDPKARRGFWDLIYETAESGKTVFVTTHYMDEAEYCHRISIMRQGKLIALDSPAHLREKYRKKSMQDVFISLVGTEGGGN
jgi:drug efflux transport system ATP-binding protein